MGQLVLDVGATVHLQQHEVCRVGVGDNSLLGERRDKVRSTLAARDENTLYDEAVDY